MRKILLTTASILVLCAGAAMAEENGPGGGDGGWHGTNPPPRPSPPTMEQYLAVAVGVNMADLDSNRHSLSNGQTNSTSLSGSFQGASGVANQNQNAGANSAMQNSLSLAYVQGCDCGTTVGSGRPTGSVGDAATFAAALNFGAVTGGGGYWDSLPVVRSPAATHATASISGGSYNGFIGAGQVNQNSGAGSALQNATAIASVSPISGSLDQDKLALGMAGNFGLNGGNTVTNNQHNTSASIDGSFNNMTGQVNVNQNSAANALMQNSTALSTIEYCGCAANDLSISAALSGNDGHVGWNSFAAANGSNAASMNGSFNGSTGLLQVSQNAGANSLLQNAAAVATITQH